MLKSHLLSLLISLSGLGGTLVALSNNARYPKISQRLAACTAFGCFLLGVLLYWQFDPTCSGLQFQESYLWIKQWNIRYAVGIDGLSLNLILLSILTTCFVVLTAWRSHHHQSAQYLSHFFWIQALIIGSFAATDAIFFYVCWEAVLIPILLNIGTWGGKKRAYASIKFFLYTFAGSVGLLISFLYLGHQFTTANFDIQQFYSLALNQTEQLFLFLGFFLAFTIKIPLWPLHTWLPDAHTEAPTEGSIVLSGLMLKLGAYGLLRFCLPIVPDASQKYALIVCILSVIAIIYAGLITLIQTDMKRLIAYSSIAHMGIVVLGIFVIFLQHASPTQGSDFQLLALEGAVIQMISHALSTAGLFLCVGILYHRFRSREISDYEGLATLMPLLGTFAFIFILSTIGLPGTAGFVGEFLIIISAVRAHIGIGFLTATTLLLSAAYGLWFYTRLFWGTLKHPLSDTIMPLTISEKLALCFMGSLILIVGLCPHYFFSTMIPTLEHILHLSLQHKL